MNQITCPKCQGKGYISNYKHVEDGICFLCYGSGVITQEEYTAYENEGIRRDAARAKKLQVMNDQYEKAKAERAVKRAEDERKRKETDEYNRTHDVYSDDANKAIDDFLKFCEGE